MRGKPQIAKRTRSPVQNMYAIDNIDCAQNFQISTLEREQYLPHMRYQNKNSICTYAKLKSALPQRVFNKKPLASQFKHWYIPSEEQAQVEESAANNITYEAYVAAHACGENAAHNSKNKGLLDA